MDASDRRVERLCRRFIVPGYIKLRDEFARKVDGIVERLWKDTIKKDDDASLVYLVLTNMFVVLSRRDEDLARAVLDDVGSRIEDICQENAFLKQENAQLKEQLKEAA